MSQILIDQAIKIKEQYQKGNITSSQYFTKLASFGKKYNLSVWEIQKHI